MITRWFSNYQRSDFFADVIAGIIVGVLVIPQSLGYAVLAGLPPVYGLYAAIVPVLIYAFTCTSRIQAVGPVAITAIMTASTLADYTTMGSDVYISMATLLAIQVGLILWLAGICKIGWITQFISRGVASGFISGAAVLIFVSQLSYITSIDIQGANFFSATSSLLNNHLQLHMPTFTIGCVCFALFAVNKFSNVWDQPYFYKRISKQNIAWLKRLFPLAVIVVTILVSRHLSWQQTDINLVGNIPSGLPTFTLPYVPTLTEFITLLPAASLMALIVFFSSNSISGHYARIRNETIDVNTELKALGLANLGGGFFQSFTIAGGFSRTAVNVDSGAQSPLASIVTIAVMITVLVFLEHVFASLPYALLGAMIMSSILGLIDVKTFLYAWTVDRIDAIALLVTFTAVLIFGLNMGLVIGLLVSFASLVWQSSHPHIAVVGLLSGTEHFRNIHRHDVQTFDKILIMRVDESLFFANSETVHQQINHTILQYPKATEVILMMSAVNYIDLSAQEMLITLNNEIIEQNKRLHYSVIKGPVMDIIEQTPVIKQLSGQVFLSTISAVQALRIL